MNVSMTGGPRAAHPHAWGDIWGRPHGEWGRVEDHGEENMARLARASFKAVSSARRR